MTELTFDDAVEYLQTTDYGKILIAELTSRREACLAALSGAADDKQLWQLVGQIDAFDTLATQLAEGA